MEQEIARVKCCELLGVTPMEPVTVLETAYAEWLEFIDHMERTSDGTIRWDEIGTTTFAGLQQATTLWHQRETTNVYLTYCKCICSLIFVKYFPQTFPAPSAFIYGWVKTYHGLPLARRPLTELQALARANYVWDVPSVSPIVWALAVLETRRWGFNTFAVKSKLNDDVLKHIRGYVYQNRPNYKN